MNPLTDPAARPVIGHRGACGLAPENTLASLELALEQGAEALEFDLQLSADGIPVLMHDPSLDRTTASSGPLRTRTAAELATLDAGFRFTTDGGRTFPWRARGIYPPSLTEVLRRLPATPLLIELKSVEVAEPARRVLLEHAARDRVVVASFKDEALEVFRRGGFVTAASRRGILSLWLRSWTGMRAPDSPDRAYAVPRRYKEWVPVPTAGFVRAARKAGRPVHVWTVDDPSQATRLWRRGVSGIITNFPDRMVAQRQKDFSG